jgi:hypothetical protein
LADVLINQEIRVMECAMTGPTLARNSDRAVTAARNAADGGANARQLVSAAFPRLAIIAAVLAAASVLASELAPARPLEGSEQYQLQMRQQAELDALRAQIHARILLRPESKLGNDVEMYRELYRHEAQTIRDKYLKEEARGQEIDISIDRFATERDENGKVRNSDIENTGSKPKDVRSDVDLAAKSPQVAKRQAEIWRKQGHEVDVDSYPHKYIDKTTDTTLWFDCSPNPKCGAARATDYDAFFTEGGLQRTGNTGAIVDPKGFGIDNDWKFNQGIKEFEHGLAAGDQYLQAEGLKTIAKSVDKAADAAGLKVPENRFFQQTEGLRSYKDPVEVGISNPDDPDPVEQAKVRAFIEQARKAMAEARERLDYLGERLDAARALMADALRQFDPNAATKLDRDRERIRLTNEVRENAIAELKREIVAGLRF